MDTENLATSDLIDKAEQLEEAGLFTEAARIWRQVVTRRPDPISLCRLGSLLLEIGDWPEGERAFWAATDLDKNLPEPYEGLGLLYLEVGDNKAAQDQFKRSLEIEANARRFTLLGVAQMRLDLIEVARESFGQAIDLDPSYEEASYNLALTHRDDDLAKAGRLFEKALELDPQYASAHRELGWVFRKLDERDKAEFHLLRAIALDASDGWAYIYLGNLLWGNLDLSSAERFFLKATEVWPDDSTPYWCLAIFYEYTDRAREADLFYEQAVRLNPDDPQANLRFGLYLKETRDSAKAKIYLERVLTLEPENERARSALAEIDQSR